MVKRSKLEPPAHTTPSIEVSELEEKLSLRDEEILELRAKVYALRDELHGLKNARVLGKVIKARDVVGAARRGAVRLPRRTLHGTRVVIAPLVPGRVRKSLKMAYGHSRAGLRHNYNSRFVTTEIVQNEPWENKPLVSVVIPYYNRANTIDDTLDSLAKQTFTSFETIIVDDGSTEQDSVQKLKSIQKAWPDVTIVHQPNQGVAMARNNGIKQAKGKYIVCLDSDDLLERTFIEKCTTLLETHPDTGLTTTYMRIFGVKDEVFEHMSYSPLLLPKNNTVITAAEFRKEAWEVSGGYKSSIGYEDWEYWLNLAEHGYWGLQIAEPLFRYRAALQSRYVEDKDVHWNNLRSIKALHPKYQSNVKQLLSKRQLKRRVISTDSAFINLSDERMYQTVNNGRPNTLIAIPWMTFGGAETLVLNLCRELQDLYNLSFMTGLRSEHQWDYKFREISPYIYHLAELLGDPELYVDFISNYIRTRRIDIVHMIHTNFMFDMLPELRQRHPGVKFILTMFNDRVPEYFMPSVELDDFIDIYTTDNLATANHYRQELPAHKQVEVIPNGIDCTTVFSPALFDRDKERTEIGVGRDDLAVFFIGRLSPEKNPDVFVAAAKQLLSADKDQKLKFFVVGDGPMRPQVERQIKESKKSTANQRITDLGYRSDIARLLAAADVFVLPSSIEGFPLSILEAMAMKVAVVASDVGAVKDVLESGKDGFVVEPGSVSEIVKTLEALRSNPELLRAVKLAARKKLEANYSSQKLKTNYNRLYKGQLK